MNIFRRFPYAVMAAALLSFTPSLDAGSVLTKREIWHDAARSRDLPIKFYFPIEGTGPFPIIIFSHGVGGSREAFSYLGEAWASHGYVAVFLQHPGTDEALLKEKHPLEALRAAATNPKNMALRLQDVSFAIDELTRKNAAQTNTFPAKLDLTRIGLGGHSMGAMTTLGAIGQRYPSSPSSARDPRITAALVISPQAARTSRLSLADIYGDIHGPVFHVTGTSDKSILDSAVTPESRQVPYQSIPAANQYLLIFKDAEHSTYNDEGLSKDSPLRKRVQLTLEKATIQWWEATLRNSSEASNWLSDPKGLRALLKPGDRLERKGAAAPLS
jgi:predicted dienelactone hydrolase